MYVGSLAGCSGIRSRRQYSKRVPPLDHVFVIMMENHGYYQVIDNPNEPYLNSLIANKKVNLATNYFAVGHPSLTNYLEIVGGSNFGIRSDNAPNWGSTTCSPNIESGAVNADDNGGNAPANIKIEASTICPISGVGKDAETPAVDTWNEAGTIAGPNGSIVIVIPYIADIDGVKHVPAANTAGKSIGDQLVATGKSWKSYQESIPLGSLFEVNYSNGTATNLTDFSKLKPFTKSDVVQLYAVKHNPFAYFKSVQDGWRENNSLKNVVGFDGAHGLYADLVTGEVPNLAFIAPNQCDDQHGRGNADKFCAFDFGDANGFTNGDQSQLNPGLIQQGDVTIERLVHAIHASPAWKDSRSAIVIVWDENDYSGITTKPNGLFPKDNQNKVVLTVETNLDPDDLGVRSGKYYNSYSLLKSLEAAFGLPCLNHACDSGVSVMTDLFGHGPDKD
jgi:phosphatidylinositol-3-phosphatase